MRGPLRLIGRLITVLLSLSPLIGSPPCRSSGSVRNTLMHWDWCGEFIILTTRAVTSVTPALMADGLLRCSRSGTPLINAGCPTMPTWRRLT
jgi:hypothetical protein